MNFIGSNCPEGRKRSAACQLSSNGSVRTKSSTKKCDRKKRKMSKKPKINFLQLPPIAMNQIISNLSIQDHTNLRAVCKYTNEEIDIYWRTQRSITISKILTWFPNLRRNEEYKLGSITTLNMELQSVFNLLKIGNLRNLNLCGIKSIDWETFCKIIESATGIKSFETLNNVVELDIRGCFLSPDDFVNLSNSMPNLKTIIIDEDLYIPNKMNILGRSKKYEISHLKSLADFPKRHFSSRIGFAATADSRIVPWIELWFPRIENIFIKLNKNSK